MREVIINLARMHCAAFAHELEQLRRPFLFFSGPEWGARRILILLSRPREREDPRMHQRVYGTRHEAVVDEEILLDAELRVAAFEVAGTVVLDAMAQGKVLGARGRANRVGLHKAEPVESALQRGRREEAVGDGKAAQVVESDQHDQMLLPHPVVLTSLNTGCRGHPCYSL